AASASQSPTRKRLAAATGGAAADGKALIAQGLAAKRRAARPPGRSLGTHRAWHDHSTKKERRGTPPYHGARRRSDRSRRERKCREPHYVTC
ncbi:hypothetical protein, partial [Tahibacter caeni]|uniref:hypothetical protein n=1 Tax=Tahibacter caeni TaxID=1453545 RepID=UPI0021486608